MAIQYGLTPLGFVPKQQQVIIGESNASLQTAFGANINLASNSVLGQIVGIFSEREALLWQLGEAIAQSRYPSGAEGTSVDDILALNNLSRLTAQPTVTNPEIEISSIGITLYGLLLYGTPGTTIPALSTINTTASPPLGFTLDANEVIGATVDCEQSIFFSNAPDSGALSLTFTDPAGTAMTTPTMPFNVIAAQTQVSIGSTPVASSSFKLVLTLCGVPLTTAAISTNSAYPTASAVQTAITALSGYSAVTVSGGSGSYVITWGAISQPIVTVTNNTTTATISVIDSAQAHVNNLLDTDNTYYPFTDVAASGFILGLSFAFGALSAVGSNPFSGSQQIPPIAVASNSLLDGSTVTNLNSVMITPGSGYVVAGVAYGTVSASATCTVTGPNFVAANTLTVIGSPISGWQGVVNQLDCVTGSNVETDTQALQRRSTLLAAQANGPLQAIIAKVKQVSGVTDAIGFQNLNDSALQVFSFASVPVTGAYQIQIGSLITGSVAYNAVASVIQTAIRLLPGYSLAIVTGTIQFGFTLDYNGAMGGQGQPLLAIVNNTTGVIASSDYGRPGHSFEIVPTGGSDLAIATAIYGSQPAGIKSYGSTTAQIFDADNNPVLISFSRPTQIPIYVVISLITDTFNTPGNTGSGVNPKAKFNPQSVSTIQQDIATIGNSIGTGGLIIGFGSNGLVGAFNAVPGIVDYTIAFGETVNPTQNVNIQMLSEQNPSFELFNIVVSYS